jgi:hypothetical protein
MPEDLFKKRALLTKRERKYCTCLLKVREKSKINPYAICTRSLYNLQGIKRRKIVDCDYNYNYEKIPVKMLRSLATERKVPIKGIRSNRNKLTPKKTLINRLSRRITERRTERYKSLKNKK